MMDVNFDLEALYMPSRWCSHRSSPDEVIQKHIDTVTKESAETQRLIPFESNVKYGNRPRQLMHIFSPPHDKGENIPTFIYIHGGYWQELNKDISCYCVRPLIKSGIRVIIPDYDLAPDVSLGMIVEEVVSLITFIIDLKSNRQWGSIWLSGHSAGAHLAASILCTNLYDKISGFILLSGIYDLVPLLKTSVNVALNLTKDEAIKESPIHQLSGRNLSYHGTILLVVGEYESPAFHHQQSQFFELLQSKGVDVLSKTIPHTDHFSLVEQLSYENYVLTNSIIKLIQNRIM